MRGTCAALSILAFLAACGDPLRDIERVSELPEPLPEAQAAALPDSSELEDKTPIFAGLFQRRAPAPDPAIEAALREANGLDPLPETENAAPGPAAPQGEAEAARTQVPPLPSTDVPAAAPAGRGVLGWLRRGAETETADAEVPAAAPETDQAVLAVEPDKVETVLPEVEVAALDTAELAPEPQKRVGLFGRAFGRDAPPARKLPSSSGPDARDITLGTELPFGEIARVCGAKPRDMGEIVDRAARKGRGYVMYDSAPGSAGARAFFVTGFDDNCPRQFTAALALFGEPLMHEQLRYGLPARDLPYSATDEAYEDLKARVCHVSRSKPCGARLSRLEKTTTFVSVYENFGENARWSDILLHDGEVLAASLKEP